MGMVLSGCNMNNKTKGGLIGGAGGGAIGAGLGAAIGALINGSSGAKMGAAIGAVLNLRSEFYALPEGEPKEKKNAGKGKN